MMVNNLQIQKLKLYFKKVKSKFCRVKKCTYLCKKIRIMTDKEKIELIMQEKHLNNTQFCNEVCIAPGTFSHIRSGRTEPSLNILRSVSMAFPDINPSWLFFDEGDMYRDSASSASSASSNDDASAASVDESANAALYGSYSPLEATAASQSRNGSALSPDTAALATGVGHGGQSRTALDAHKVNMAGTFSIQDIVAETMRQQVAPSQRKVVEVRIFFDDGTFEVFGPK